MLNIKNYILLSCGGLAVFLLSGCLVDDVAKIIEQRQAVRNAKPEPKPWKAFAKVVNTKFTISNLKVLLNGNHSYRISGNVSQCKYLLETGERKYNYGTRNTSQRWRDWMPDKVIVSNPFGKDTKISVKKDGSFFGNLSIYSQYYAKHPSRSDEDDWCKRTKNILIQPYYPPHNADFNAIRYPLKIWLSWYTAQTESSSAVK